MKKSIAFKWADALESGQYTQGFDQLRTVDKNGNTTGFCCLGVLCNLHAQAHPKIALKETDPETYLGSYYGLPKLVQEWADMYTPEGDLVSGNIRLVKDEYYSLMEANDYGTDFKTIAQFIRKNYRNL